jgi:hypothetical protein
MAFAGPAPPAREMRDDFGVAEPTRFKFVTLGWSLECVMCEKCVEFDERIARYRSLAGRLTDQVTLDGIARLIEHYEIQKRELHPAPEE